MNEHNAEQVTEHPAPPYDAQVERAARQIAEYFPGFEMRCWDVARAVVSDAAEEVKLAMLTEYSAEEVEPGGIIHEWLVARGLVPMPYSPVPQQNGVRWHARAAFIAQELETVKADFLDYKTAAEHDITELQQKIDEMYTAAEIEAVKNDLETEKQNRNQAVKDCERWSNKWAKSNAAANMLQTLLAEAERQRDEAVKLLKEYVTDGRVNDIDYRIRLYLQRISRGETKPST